MPIHEIPRSGRSPKLGHISNMYQIFVPEIRLKFKDCCDASKGPGTDWGSPAALANTWAGRLTLLMGLTTATGLTIEIGTSTSKKTKYLNFLLFYDQLHGSVTWTVLRYVGLVLFLVMYIHAGTHSWDSHLTTHNRRYFLFLLTLASFQNW